MDFSIISQLKSKKFWWLDVIFYFVIALLVAVVLCYIIFAVKSVMEKNDIAKEVSALQTVGTDQQKEYETSVLGYQKKLNDFNSIFKNHEFASNVFAFMQSQTQPDVWFRQFGLDEKNSTVQLVGEAENMEAISRQVADFEKNEYVKNIGNLNSSLGTGARFNFNLNLSLDPKIFGYLSATGQMSIINTTTPSHK